MKILKLDTFEIPFSSPLQNKKQKVSFNKKIQSYLPLNIIKPAAKVLQKNKNEMLETFCLKNKNIF